MSITPEDFSSFFEDVHGYRPFPWQTRLARMVLESGKWPTLLDLPTGTGKTACIDIAVFHLACEAEKKEARQAPLRILFVIDRRIVVDAAFEHARRIAEKLREGKSALLAAVAERLRLFAGPDAPPLDVVRLRGGVPQERDWARSPAQPVVVVSTVDQVGSRLLFRGYGVSSRMWPVHAGLVGADALWLLDEVHLSQPLKETLDAIVRSRGTQLKQRESPRLAPFGVVNLTATPGAGEVDAFRLDAADREHELLRQRLSASKIARLEQYDEEPSEAFALHALRFAGLLEEEGGLEQPEAAQESIEAPARRIAVVVNHVDLARRVFEKIVHEAGDRAEVLLLTGRIRPLDRDVVLRELKPLYANVKRSSPDRPIILVSTQTIEAGADIDVDALITQIAPLDCLRQRFGRLDRLGIRHLSRAVILYPRNRAKEHSWAAISRIYGESAHETKEWLDTLGKEIDFGIDAFEKNLATIDGKKLGVLIAPRSWAPVLLPPYIDLWAMTSPAPTATPEPSFFLHGPGTSADVHVVWRAAIDPEDEDLCNRLLHLMPPSALEAVSVPIWVARQWLRGDNTQDEMADVPEKAPESKSTASYRGKAVVRWNESEEKWEIKYADEITPGDTIVAPSSYGGCDKWGWNSRSREEVVDLGPEAHYYQRRKGALCLTCATLANALMKDEEDGHGSRAAAADIWGRITRFIADMGDDTDAEAIRAMLYAEEGLPETWRHLLAGLRDREPTIEFLDNNDRARGFVLYGKRTLESGLLTHREDAEDGSDAVTGREDSSAIGKEISLLDHLNHVERWARKFASRACLDDHLTDLVGIAARLHDLGKAEPRFQADLRGVNALTLNDPEFAAMLISPGDLLAKSARIGGGRVARYRHSRAAPEDFRHEALSVALAARHPDVLVLNEEDRDLVLWLIGTHHGYGRPFFPPCVDEVPEIETKVLIDNSIVTAKAHEAPIRLDQGWFERATRLNQMYGPWELARLEAILRLADHAASAEAMLS